MTCSVDSFFGRVSYFPLWHALFLCTRLAFVPCLPPCFGIVMKSDFVIVIMPYFYTDTTLLETIDSAEQNTAKLLYCTQADGSDKGPHHDIVKAFVKTLSNKS